MATTHFYAKPYKDKLQIFLSVTYQKGKRLRYYTGEKVPDGLWDVDKECVKPGRLYPQHVEQNSLLRRLANETERIIAAYGNQKSALTSELLKRELDAYRNKDQSHEENQPITFEQFFEKFIEGRRAKSHKYAAGSIVVYETALKKIQEFEKHRKAKIDFDSFDYIFFEQFSDFIYDLGKFRPNNEPFKRNYVHKIISTVITVLREAERDEKSTELKCKSDWNPVKREEVDAIYLTLADLEKLSTLNLPPKGRLDKVRDLFLIGCHTGLRYSDYSQLKPDNFIAKDGRLLVRVLTQKTKTLVEIPVKSALLDILNKHKVGNEYILPKGISNAKMNDYLKELGELAGLTEPVSQITSKNGKPVLKTVAKYHLISTHTARRTFASTAFFSGVPSRHIMKMTGHKTETEFNKYLKLDEHEIAMMTAEHSFFK